MTCNYLANAALRFACVSLFASAGCASGELPPRTADDPANPQAAEAPVAPLAAASAVPTPQNAHDHEGASAQTIYECPMHPEVRQATPGKCPKCGMTLVVKPHS